MRPGTARGSCGFCAGFGFGGGGGGGGGGGAISGIVDVDAMPGRPAWLIVGIVAAAGMRGTLGSERVRPCAEAFPWRMFSASGAGCGSGRLFGGGVFARRRAPGEPRSMSSSARRRSASLDRGVSGRCGDASDALFACVYLRGGVGGGVLRAAENTSNAVGWPLGDARGSGSGRPAPDPGGGRCIRVVFRHVNFLHPDSMPQRLASMLGVRAFSSARAALVPRRAKRILQNKKDENLRHAISLYHLAPSFYPAPEKDESPSAHAEELEASVAESILGPFSSEYEGRPFVRFANTQELMSEHRRTVREGRRDTLGEVDVYDTSNIQRIFVSARGRPEEPSDDSLRSRQHFVNPPSAYPTRRARDAAGHGDMYRNEELSLRSAQVRDALFGTVAGELPSLEIVREREREWKNDSEK